ncbi:alpha/beta hydrolase [Nonomuraea sp. NN258]|uniref:alpha/beta fold hydrolase n=1 Tax=Nonomuraea antri TaxID=2730852 RepID=UPI00156807A7|nr:alpha/beta hydrolase [Nonomuraea antri]NRQ39814.1 alpha/beta hydrolase [Nonomuraea antri]
MTPRWTTLALVTSAAIAAAGATSAAYQKAAERADFRRFPPPGRLITVDGRRIHVWAEGVVGPTVVILPGMTDNGLAWVSVRRRLAPGQRVWQYDRAGLGWSQAAPWWQWRGSPALADELHEVLQASEEPGPFLLVGHSMGGEIARFYAARHRDQVAGMVLVDAPSERMTCMVDEFGWWEYGPVRHWQRALTSAVMPCGLVRARLRLAILRGQEPDLLRRMRQRVPAELVELGLALELTSGQRRAEVMEDFGRTGVLKALEAERRRFGDLPLTVISKAPHPAPGTYYHEYFTNRPPDVAERYNRVWERIQTDLAGLSDNGTLIVAERAAHNIQVDEPKLIAEAVTEMCAKVRAAGQGSRPDQEGLSTKAHET